MRQLIKSTKPAVVKVSAQKSGSGFLVPGGYVVTCAHVLDGAASVTISNHYLGSTKAQPVELDEGRDLAILRLNLATLPHLDLGSYRDLEEGDEVAFLGYPLAVDMHQTHRAIVSYKGRIKFDDLPEPVDAFCLDGAVNKGNSGGPVVAVGTGTVIGIVNAKLGALSKSLRDSRSLHETIKALGLGVDVQFGVVEFADGRRAAGFDPAATADTLAEVVDFLDNYTNAGIGYAISIDYVCQLMARIES
jgi:S1-C subfamily serine protease